MTENTKTSGEAALELYEIAKDDITPALMQMLHYVRSGKTSVGEDFDNLVDSTSGYVFLLRMTKMLKECIDNNDEDSSGKVIAIMFAFLDMEENSVSALHLKDKEK